MVMKILPFNSLVFVWNLSINLTLKRHRSFHVIWNFYSFNGSIINKRILNIKNYITMLQIRKFFIHNFCNRGLYIIYNLPCTSISHNWICLIVATKTSIYPYEHL